MTTALERGEHGTATTWRQGCRCPRCRSALRRRARVWWATRRVRAGADPASYTAARPVRAHVEALRAAGMTSAAIARAAGVSEATVSRLRKRSTRWCSRIVAAAVLTVAP